MTAKTIVTALLILTLAKRKKTKTITTINDFDKNNNKIYTNDLFPKVTLPCRVENKMGLLQVSCYPTQVPS